MILWDALIEHFAKANAAPKRAARHFLKTHDDPAQALKEIQAGLTDTPKGTEQRLHTGFFNHSDLNYEEYRQAMLRDGEYK